MYTMDKKAKEIINQAIELGYQINDGDELKVESMLWRIDDAKDMIDIHLSNETDVRIFSMIYLHPADVAKEAVRIYKYIERDYYKDVLVITASDAMSMLRGAKEAVAGSVKKAEEAAKKDAEYKERCKEGKFVSQEDYAELVDYNHLMFDEFGEYLKADDTDGDAAEEVMDNTVTNDDTDTTTDEVAEEVTDDNNKTDDVTVTKKNEEDNKTITSKEVRINDADFERLTLRRERLHNSTEANNTADDAVKEVADDCLLHPRYDDELSGEQLVRITETLIPMERFLLYPKNAKYSFIEVYISPDFDRGKLYMMDEEGDKMSADFKVDGGLNPADFGSVEEMIKSLVNSYKYIPEGIARIRQMKGAILPTLYGDIYSAMDDKTGTLHTWIWRDDEMKSIDHLPLIVDYSNWQNAIEYILAENIADGLDLAAV